jgi:hypothetical protein
MKGDKIYYTDGWDYVLSRPYSVFTGIFPKREVIHEGDFILTVGGWLHIEAGYPWDGASGAFDTKNAMRGSLVHDCFCEMMRRGDLEYDFFSPFVHDLLGNICEEDGMWEFRADAWRKATRIGRGGHPSHPDPHPELKAP